MAKKQFKEFDVLTVPLEKVNLVEASAGTGKTFSIAVLVLRLILEKNFNIKEILLVTFTNNAVAELDERIRSFLRNAFDYAKNKKSTEKVIQEVVDNNVRSFGEEEIVKRLSDSILFLDETSVMTIHSFCHQTLGHLAFETGQLFDAELVSNFDNVVTQQIQEFWRRHIVTLPVPTLQFLSAERFNQAAIKTIINNHLAGKRYHTYTHLKSYTAGIADNRIHSDIATFTNEIGKHHAACNKLLTEQREQIRTNLETDHYGKTFVQNLSDIDTFLKEIDAKRNTKYIKRFIPADILNAVDRISEIKERFNETTISIIDLLYCAALEEVTKGIDSYAVAKGIISYNDLIKNLHRALSGANRGKIIAALQRQYRAAFIDEFQDTDKLQFDIFLGAFHSAEILFLIGDPKQSIYAFRQADINTYFKAYSHADYLYNMNVNFRSSVPVINAMNEFFQPDDFDFFHFGKAENEIQYFPVISPKMNTKGTLEYDGKVQKGITIRTQQKGEILLEDVCLQVYCLLTDKKYTITSGGNTEAIKPSDIAILVKDKKYGHVLQQILGRYNIPSVFVADETIMQSEQAAELYHVLRAIFDPAVENINAALVNSFTGYKAADTILFDAEKIIEFFKTYKVLWETQSIYRSLSAFIADFGIEDYLRKPETASGLRIITNLLQLMELLHKTAYHQRFNQAELLNWYQRAIEVELLEKDESTLRLESDSDAITIMTIHRSKGLQFKIVMAAQMDFSVGNGNRLEALHENDEYITLMRKQMSDTQESNFKRQSEQEFRRLMYVAVTRAVAKAYIFHTTANYYKSSALTRIIELLKHPQFIEISSEALDPETIDYSQKYQSEKNNSPKPEKLVHPFILKDPSWRYMSYSGLAAKENAFYGPLPTNDSTENSAYDEFVFQKLRKGSVTGNMIHYILERINFSNTEFHDQVIAEAIDRFAGAEHALYGQFLPQLVHHILNSAIETDKDSFHLAAIANDSKIAEMEFDFSTAGCDADALSALLLSEGLGVRINANEPLHGLMKGFIDLLFVHEGKYYILDWKSNYLGNHLSDYKHTILNDAMVALNYQLQFMIYTIAVKKYLTTRLGNFNYENFGGVIYCFVRGMRSASRNGVYFYRPTEETVNAVEELLSPAYQSQPPAATNA